MSVIECAWCEKTVDELDDAWPRGWGCLFNCLAVCSRSCAEKFAKERSRYGCIPAGMLEFPEGESVEEETGS